MKHGRPLQHLAQAGKMYPRAWSGAEHFLNGRGSTYPTWPDWCFLPMAAWHEIVRSDDPSQRIAMLDVARLAAIGTWRYCQGIYEFDPDIYSALIESPPKGKLPVDLFYRLPEWCAYIVTPGATWLGSTLYGFWVHLEHDMNTGGPELRLLMDSEAALVGVPLILGNWTVEEAVDRAIASGIANVGLEGVMKSSDLMQITVTDNLKGLLSLALYLCSDEPDIDDQRVPGSSPGRPSAKRIKGGLRWFPASRPRVWSVGNQWGNQLRNDLRGDPTGRRVAMHLRRGHWHGYWIGKRDGGRKFTFKFLPPMIAGSREE